MAQFDWQGAWESSRLLTWLVNFWEGSLTYRLIMAVIHYMGRIGPHSLVGRIILSDWPTGADYADSAVGRMLLGLNRWLERLLKPLGAFLARTWEASLLWRAVCALFELLETSLVYQWATGHAAETALAPTETSGARPSLLLPMLGAVLGFIALIPSPNPGEGGLNPTMLMILGIWGVADLWILQRLMTGNFAWRASAAFVPLLAFLAIAATAAWQSTDRLASLQTLIIWFTAGLLFFLMVNLARNSRDAAAFAGPILIAAVLMSLWAVYQWRFPPVVEEHWVDPSEGNLVRTFAGMNNPNYLALFFELYTPIAVALWVQQPRRRFAWSAVIGLMGLGLLLTQSRAGWLGLAVAGAVFIALRASRWTFLLFLGVIVGWLAAPAAIKARVLTAFDPKHTSNIYRNNIRIGVLAMIQKFWVAGAGLGGKAFSDVYQEFMLAEARAAHAHNTYLEMLAETGIFGFTAILWALFAVVRRTVVLGAQKLRSPIIAGVASALIGVLVHATAEHIWYNPKLLLSFWAVAGLGMGLALGDKEGAEA